ncbi:MAG: hypothetical protein HGN29_12780 [Asgard group archaeon]|nr:hypothetical protein [Asgard group archaeon]
MAAEETVFSVYPCVNCNTFNNSNNDLCAKCGVFLHGDKKLCSNCKNPLSVDKEKCDYCDFTIKEKITVFVNFKNFYKKEKERFIDIIYGKRSRENIMNEYGLKGFDTFTGFIDWELFDLFEIVDEELKYLPTAKYILSDNASELFLSKYGLTKEYNIEEKIRKTVENLNKKVNSGEFLQSFPEVGISFSLVAEVYNKYFDFEHRDFNNWEQEELARNLLRALVNFYSSLLQNSNVLDEENVIDRKLILFSTILFDITFCIELSDSLSF